MSKSPVVFSLIKEQSNFMTIIMSILTFLSVLAFGIAISIGTGVINWNKQWTNHATIQVVGETNAKLVQEIIDKNIKTTKSVHKFTTAQMKNLMEPWLSNGTALESYIPNMWEIEFKTKSDMITLEREIKPHAKFLTHASALKNPMHAGWKLIGISGLILLITLCTIGVCVSYIARNTAMLHKRELEILNQVGANDSFVINQMRMIVSRISMRATFIGFILAVLVLYLMLQVFHSVRVGLMAMLGINIYGWLLITLLPIFIMIFTIFITKKTTLKILENN